MTTKQTDEYLYRAYLIWETLRATGESEFPAQLASTFFFVASHEGVYQDELADIINISTSSASRNVVWLTSKKRDGTKGLGLIRRERAIDTRVDPRRFQLFLTPKGRRIAALVQQHLTSPLISHKTEESTNVNSNLGDGT